jgi:hydrogenase/urease accessory protein HupE
MSTYSTIIRRALIFATAVSLLVPAAGFAHALFADNNPNRPVLEYVWIGFLHMVGGWDHLLFILGVVLIAGAIKPAAKLISLFVLGHSLTLIVATVAGWKLNATFVDVVIALSLVYVGVQGLMGRPDNFRLMGAIVFGFGLIHGLGLSTRLQDLGLPESGVLVRVILFNIGVEMGQLTALAVIVGLGTLTVRALKVPRENAHFAYSGLIVAGILAALLMAFPIFGDDEPASTQVATSSSEAESSEACNVENASPPTALGGTHPPKTYFGPDEMANEEDLTHVVGDGLVIIRYDPDLPERHHQALKEFVDTKDPPYAIAAPDPEQAEPLRVTAALRTMTCREPDMEALTAFYDSWMLEVQNRRG